VLLSGYEMAFDVDSVVHGGVADRNFCAEQALLKRCILRSAVGSADANSRPGCSSTGRAHAGVRCRDRGPLGAYDRESSVTNLRGERILLQKLAHQFQSGGLVARGLVALHSDFDELTIGRNQLWKIGRIDAESDGACGAWLSCDEAGLFER
jgi:hypothetical protein